MVSLQCANSFWSYYPEIEESAQYQKYRYIKKEFNPVSFYQDIYQSEPEQEFDPVLSPFNSFTHYYQSFSKRFKRFQHYTLFIPIQCPYLDSNINSNEVESILLQHMVPYRIMPSQIIDHYVRIETLGGYFFYQDGFNQNKFNQIVSYHLLPHASLFFISSEIK